MRLPPRYVLAAFAGVLLPSVAAACMWDYDTIKMERTRFPGTLEMITGKFLRHSPEFYQWRVENRLKRLEADPANVALLDDLAVAYDKTGRHDEAIKTALRAEQVRPGRYETAANLGTFYFHAGKLNDGLPHIGRALAINPDAHFGREKYQKLLVEYMIRQRKGGPPKLPLADVKVGPRPPGDGPHLNVTVKDSFADFLGLGKYTYPPKADELSAAIKGILGMMKFGQHDSPVLLEALGGLLTQDASNPEADAKLLAARVYLRASDEVPDGPSRAAYRAMAEAAIEMQTPDRRMGQITLERVEGDFQKELAEARDWYADLRGREMSWIRDGRDPEAEFDKLYDADPAVSGMDVRDPMSTDTRLVIMLGAVGVATVLTLAAAAAGAVYVVRRFRRTRAARAAAADRV